MQSSSSSLPPNSSSSSDARRERIRQRMREFYGDPASTSTPLRSTAAVVGGRAASLPAGRLTAGAATTTTAAAGSAAAARRVPPEMDLDSEYFNVSRYTTDLLRRESLQGLVEVDTQLLRTVRQLDGELQELVYRNYAKFIAATDTIREMRDSVADMDSKLVALSSKVAHTDALSQHIATQLQAHRSRIEQTMAANRMLKKVQFLVALPRTLRTLMERGAYAVAVKYWVAGDGFLAKHQHMTAIAAIHDECRTLARQLYARIEAAMCAIALDDVDGMDAVRCHVEDLRLLRATSLGIATRDGARADDDGQAHANGDADADVSFDEAVLRTLLRSVTASFVSGVEAAQRGLRSAATTVTTATSAAVDAATIATTATAALPPLEQRASALSDAAVREALAEVKSACALLSLNTERVYALLLRTLGGKDSQDIAMRVAQEVQPVLLDLLTPLQATLTQLATTTLDRIAGDGAAVLQTPRRVHEALQQATQALMQQLKHLRVTLRTLGQNYLDTAHSQQSAAYGALVDDAVANVLRACAAQCARYADGAVASHELARYSNAVTAASTLSVQQQQQRLCYSVVRFAYATLTSLLLDGIDATLIDGDAMPRGALDDVVATLLRAGRALQHRAVILLGQVSLHTVWHSAFGPDIHNNNSDGSDVVTVSSSMLQLLQDWTSVYHVLRALPPPSRALAAAASATTAASTMMATAATTPTTTTMTTAMQRRRLASSSSSAVDPSRDHPMTAAAAATTAMSPTTNATTAGVRLYVAHTQQEQAMLRSHIDRLFSHDDALLHTCPGDGKCGTTMWCLVVYTCKALVERARAATTHYTVRAFQRLQVNCTFLLRALLAPAKGSAARRWLRDWASPDKPRLVQSLLDGVCVSAYAQCAAQQRPHDDDDDADTVALTDAAIDRILDEAVLQQTRNDDEDNNGNNNNGGGDVDTHGNDDSAADKAGSQHDHSSHTSSSRSKTTTTTTTRSGDERVTHVAEDEELPL